MILTEILEAVDQYKLQHGNEPASVGLNGDVWDALEAEMSIPKGTMGVNRIISIPTFRTGGLIRIRPCNGDFSHLHTPPDPPTGPQSQAIIGTYTIASVVKGPNDLHTTTWTQYDPSSPKTPSWAPKRCECGSEAVGSSSHSTWCPLC